MRPRSAENYLKWRRAIDEHLELRRLTWDEYAMFNWLCTKASARTGIVRTSWRTLAEQTGLTPNHVEQLCRRLKRKHYVWYPPHRGVRGRLSEVAIDKFPTTAGTNTDLSARFAEVPAEGPTHVPADVRAEGSTDLPADVPAEVPADVGRKTPAKSRGSPSGRRRSEEREEEREREEQGRFSVADTQEPVAIREVLATQSWWRPRPDGGEIRGPPKPEITRSR